jgi:SAM-dependent methyltransferase
MKNIKTKVFPDMTESTKSKTYTERLSALEQVWWKRLIPVQLPYKLNLKSLKPGFTLDIGCGLGRNLRHLNGKGVGIDTNEFSVREARHEGFIAFTPEEFLKSDYAVSQQFDSILLAHVLEHMPYETGKRLLADYMGYLKEDGKIILICPQEAGYLSDKTHVEYMDQMKLKNMLRELGCHIHSSYSFPFPSFMGRMFLYNEHVVVGIRP